MKIIAQGPVLATREPKLVPVKILLLMNFRQRAFRPTALPESVRDILPIGSHAHSLLERSDSEMSSGIKAGPTKARRKFKNLLPVESQAKKEFCILRIEISNTIRPSRGIIER